MTERLPLKMLEDDDYEEYGNTLINFAEKVSLTPFPFAAGLGGNMKQMEVTISGTPPQKIFPM